MKNGLYFMILKLIRKLLNDTFLHNVTIDSSPQNENPSFTHPNVVLNLFYLFKQ